MNREDFIQELFPQGVSKLWCPILTHYRSDNSIDYNRITKHIEYLLPNCSSYLIPGSTGDAWELTETETDSLLEFALKNAAPIGYELLIGVLEKDADTTLRIMNKRINMLKDIAGVSDVRRAMELTGVKGFVICPPANIDDQKQVYSQLEAVLKTGLPICLYQLPQVTNSEMTPQTVADLAKKYTNFFMLKDSGGEDKVAYANADYSGVILVRGAEENYDKHIKQLGGAYDGFLLSTVNSFPNSLGGFISAVDDGDAMQAKILSDTVGDAIAKGFELVADITAGNAFANSNKCFDYFNAYGKCGNADNIPMLHAGIRLPEDKIKAIGDVLDRAGLMPDKGYLE